MITRSNCDVNSGCQCFVTSTVADIVCENSQAFSAFFFTAATKAARGGLGTRLKIYS